VPPGSEGREVPAGVPTYDERVSVAVNIPVFEGPFDLLLHLIMREEVDIHEVSLTMIVDAYLEELARMQKLDLEVATEFLLIAATLIELKARRLLPGREPVDLDDELALWEERDLLLARLLECKTFKDVATVLAGFVEESDRVYARSAGPDERFADVAPDPLDGMTIQRLQRAFLHVITPRPVPTFSLFHISPIRFTVAETVEQLARDLFAVGRTTFRRLTATNMERLEVVVCFLAILELYKQGRIELDQADRFGDIEIAWLGVDGTFEGEVDAYDG
jgi:segregation and condensation protein A